MVRFLPFLISLVLTVYALFSCIQTPDEDVPHLPKLLWIVLIVFVPFAGPIVWLLMSRAHANRQDRAVRRQPPSQPTARPLAPDDDPDFLKSLDRYRDPRTTVRPPEPEDQPDPKDIKGSEDSSSETDDGNPER
ncbi:PLD nuclease N-terminal domain-containing protein [Kribbella sp. NPDC003557]|uniref:PLD nuclease N-terminal domain-containing protein n=1 Tax=Kribbella sp. NPDC003557 TaxID=3154449 RepID=UPI0033BE5A90